MSKPAGKRTVAPAKVSSMGGRAAPRLACMPARTVVTADADSTVTGNIVVGLCSESHFRITLALMP